jgi:hypothetical protein
MRLLLTFLLIVAVGPVTVSVYADDPEGSDLNALSLEVTALQTLHDLELTRTQLTALGKLPQECAPKENHREPAKTSPELGQALSSLRAAYARGDDNQIGDAREKLDDLMQKQQPELDNSVTITEGARSNAADAIRLLNVRQVGSLLRTLELTDPTELLLAALEQVRTLKGQDLEQETTTVAEEVSWLCFGWEDEEKSKKMKEQITALLGRASQKTVAQFAKERQSLEEAAKSIAGEVNSLDVVAHVLEQGMAELLSNPRLEAAIKIQSRVVVRPAPPARPGTTRGKAAK